MARKYLEKDDVEALVASGEEKRAFACHVARSVTDRFFGLMGQPGVREGWCLLFPKCTSIHCFWMKVPIDVCWVGMPDAHGACKVMGVEHSLKPGAVAFAPKGAWGCVEAAAGAFAGEPESFTCASVAN